MRDNEKKHYRPWKELRGDRNLVVRDGDWKLVAYAEAPMAPATMVRRMIEGQVPDDFDEYIEAQREK